jgi:hypothetical protein
MAAFRRCVHASAIGIIRRIRINLIRHPDELSARRAPCGIIAGPLPARFIASSVAALLSP